MSQELQDVQSDFLNDIRKNKVSVTVFDNFSLLLRRHGHTQLIYKHAVSTIMPSTPVDIEISED